MEYRNNTNNNSFILNHYWKILTGSALFLIRDIKIFMEQNGYNVNSQHNIKAIPGQTGISYFEGKIIATKKIDTIKCIRPFMLLGLLIIAFDIFVFIVYKGLNIINNTDLLLTLPITKLMLKTFTVILGSILTINNILLNDIYNLFMLSSLVLFLISLLAVLNINFEHCHILNYKMHIHDLLSIISLISFINIIRMAGINEIVSINFALYFSVIIQGISIYSMIFTIYDKKHISLNVMITMEGEMYKLERGVAEKTTILDESRRVGLVSELLINMSIFPTLNTSLLTLISNDSNINITTLIKQLINNLPEKKQEYVKQVVRNEFELIKNRIDSLIPKYEIPGSSK